MIEITKNEKCPVLSLKVKRQQTLEDTRQYLKEMNQFVKNQEPFGLLFDFSEGRPQREASVNKLEKQWIQSYKSELKAQCFGIALVTHSSFMLLFLKSISIYIIKRKYGCNVAIFENRIDAQMWLMDQYLLPRLVSNQDITLTPRIPMQ